MMAISLQRSLGGFKIVCFVMCATLGLWVFRAAVQARQGEKAFEVEVQVLADGKPAPGATVWMEELRYGRNQGNSVKKVGPATAPKSGVVRFSLVTGADYYQVFAKSDGGEIGLGTCHPEQAKGKENLGGENRITVNLKKTHQVKCQVFFDKKPVADAQCTLSVIDSRIEVESNLLKDIKGTYINSSVIGFPVAVKTDSEGRFVFDGVPEHAKAGIAIKKEGLGTASFRIASGESVEVELMLGGKLALSIEGETKPTFIKPWFIQPLEAPPQTTPQGRPIAYLDSGKSVFAADFSFPGVADFAPGTHRIGMHFDPALPYHYGPSQVVKIESGKTTKMVVKKSLVAQCSGRIVDQKTGKGIPNLEFRLEGTAKREGGKLDESGRSFPEGYSGKTDAEGNYSIVCRGNYDYALSFGTWHANHSDYESPTWDWESQQWMPIIPRISVAHGEKARYPDIALTPSRTVKGMVRDDSGKLVEGPFQIFCLTRGHWEQKAPRFEKDQFILSQLKPDIPLKFFIRKGKAVNLAKLVPLEDLDKTLNFTISEKNQVTGTGRIVNAKGKPISRAEVSLVWLADSQSEFRPDGRYMGTIFLPLETLATDEEGRFSASGLWAGEKFCLRVKARGYQTWTQPNEGRNGKWKGIGGKIDFGDTVLTEVNPND